MDKIPKIGFVPKPLNPDPNPNSSILMQQTDYFRWSQANTNKNFDISQIVERDRVSFIKQQWKDQNKFDAEKAQEKHQLQKIKDKIDIENREMYRKLASKHKRNVVEVKERVVRQKRINDLRLGMSPVMHKSFEDID